ncbi:cupin domain-containing protein [Piscirickettsia litoralis]|uniref:Cupin type-2 domain-containing protein n=1 Tax=Piscirickettsia litoralis TaxID=1891921 RepID=A0ABX2ZXC2_9GAMM|nr:cupin domain-containing protein [Piscirickettsia litoralis]ODN41246.1 hypothetical protein BGC07_17690 [Piscirickettsia litoralis]
MSEIDLIERPSEQKSDAVGIVNKNLPFKVSRHDIPSLHKVATEKGAYFLGVQKDFRRHADLAEHIPEQARLGIAWVHLGQGEVLVPHTHPIDSLIIVCQGSVSSLGDVEVELVEGDNFFIPSGAVHGFIGGEKGFWGLSIQFAERGLYESAAEPLVSFSQYKKKQLSSINNLSSLLLANENYQKKFESNQFFSVVHQQMSGQQKDIFFKSFSDVVGLFSENGDAALH